jgi:alkylation response protein AidB-like acyl-CoA dehydrogenase
MSELTAGNPDVTPTATLGVSLRPADDLLTEGEIELEESFSHFAEHDVRPYADRYDAEGRVPHELIKRIGARGFLGAFLPPAVGGQGLGMVAYGLLHAALARASASVQSLLTVHDMVSLVVSRWASAAVRSRYLPQMTSGRVIAAFALTESEAGSDIQNIETQAWVDAEGFRLTGEKCWITYGQVADIFLVFARSREGSAAFLVPRATPGLTVLPHPPTLGLRASMLAQLRFENCRLPIESLVGRLGMGLSPVASFALMQGRYSVAWASLGLAEVALEAQVRYAANRRQSGALLKDHQLIRQLITDGMADVESARLLCIRAGRRHDGGDSRAIRDTLLAKYVAARVAGRVTDNAVQIHGALGCSNSLPIQRYFRDARVMEIIEGSSQILQILIAEYAFREYAEPPSETNSTMKEANK